MAVVVGAFHVQSLRMRTKVFFDWVPSAANIADWPTRPDKVGLIPARARRFQIVLPPIGLFNRDIAAFVRGQD